jgi:alanyl-tRNA synthetase
MTSAEIRRQFLDFFQKNKHTVVDSAPVVLKDDPTLMFTNAGMNQFKDRFLGNSSDGDTRVTDSQKCLRVSGKHNDLEEVGVDTYHHTLFEMLGNWSFGDYFKQEAIDMAWAFLKDAMGIAPDQMYVSYFEGNNDVAEDVETKSMWLKHVKPENIIKGNAKDNFWEMGDTGPCGPCTEIHVDIRSEADRAKGDGAALVNMDHPQVIEIWNLVFIQFNRKKSGALEPLPNKHVDTGMGLERLAMVIQGKSSTYDTDIFTHLISVLEQQSGKKYSGGDSKTDIAFRVLSDHVRAVAFAIADGQLPSNTGAGYVIRRILRRAVRYAYSFLGLKEPFLHNLAKELIDLMGDHYKELKAQESLLLKVILEEENTFLKTLSVGLNMLNEASENVTGKFSGEKAFELYDTFGFPIDLTQLILSEKNIEVDIETFTAELEKQKNRSRKASKQDVDDWVLINDRSELPEFVGYDNLQSECTLVKHRKVEAQNKTFYQVVVHPTPFYPEGGGQVGDRGYLELADGSKIDVFDTKKENGLIIQFCNEVPTDVVKAVVDTNKRKATERNHSATHLLHYALREILGTHVEQKGSLVNEKALRFDFSHFSALTNEEIQIVEDRVNELVLENINLTEHRTAKIEDAKSMGAMALFGEKYGDTVRVIQFGDSIELCGGTHVPTSASVGLFVLKSESSVASGVRRLEALTANAAKNYLQQQANELSAIKTLVKSPVQPINAIENLLASKKSLESTLEKLEQEFALQNASKALESATMLSNGLRYVHFENSIGAKQSKALANDWKTKEENLVTVFTNDVEGKANLAVFVSDNLLKEKGLKAGDLIKIGAKHIQGGGGGAPFYASAGGKNPAGLPQAEQDILAHIQS